MTKNKLALVAVFFLMAAIAAALLYSRNLRRQIDEASARIAAENAGAPVLSGGLDGIGGMSISGMEIVQGEKGRERWTLVAESALMDERGGDIVAQRPRLTYYLGDGGAAGETLRVISDEGDVNQRDNVLRFVRNVVATQNNDILRTSLIIYDGVANRLNCPEESFIESVGMRGRASEMAWHLDDNTLHARGGVDIDFDNGGSSMPASGGANK